MKTKVIAAALLLVAAPAFAGKFVVPNQSVGTGGDITGPEMRDATKGFTAGLPVFVTPTEYARLLTLPGATHDPVKGTVAIPVELEDGTTVMVTYSQQGGQTLP